MSLRGSEVTDRPDLMGGLRKGLHDVCQPLTTLQCRLYLGALEDDPTKIRDGLAKCQAECDQVILRMTQLQGWIEEQQQRDSDTL